MNPERILEAVYEDGRCLTPREKAELVNFLSWLIGKVLDEPNTTTIH